MKKIMALVLALMLMLSCTGALAEIPAIINLSDTKPITNEPFTLSVAGLIADQNTTSYEDKWFWKYASEFLNINFEFEGITGTAKNERLSLMFAADDLPDFLFGFGMTTADLVRYGTVEEQLMPLEGYITPELTPNIYALKQEVPEVFAMATSPDGHMYTLPNMTYTDTAYSTTAALNQEWLKAVNKTSPTTLDELVDVLYAFKEAKPAGEATLPLGGSYASRNPSTILLYALGFDGGGAIGLDPALLNGKAVIPAGTELYLEYLKLMNQFYTDGIISLDFYTLDKAQVDAQREAGNIGLLSGYNTLTSLADFKTGWAMQPLTSKWSETPVWPGPAYFAIGNFVMSSACEHPEVVMRFMDWMFTKEGEILSEYGPPANADESVKMGYGGYYFLEDGTYCYTDYNDVENNGGYASHWDYMSKRIQGLYGGKAGDRRQIELKRQSIAGAPETGANFDMENVDRYSRKANLEVVSPFYTVGYPTITWMDEETTLAIVDLKTVIDKFIEQETAKFITGQRSLDEFDTYLNELNDLGFAEYQQYYVDAYEQYLKAL